MFIKNHTLLEGISCEGKKEASRTNIFIQYMTKTIKITIKIKIKVKFLAFFRYTNQKICVCVCFCMISLVIFKYLT